MARFGPPEIPKCLENGPFWDQKKKSQKWVKNVFFQNDPRPFGVPKQVKSALCEPTVSHFSPSKVTKCFENGLFWDKKCDKNGSKMCFSKDTFGLFGVHKQVE